MKRTRDEANDGVDAKDDVPVFKKQKVEKEEVKSNDPNIDVSPLLTLFGGNILTAKIKLKPSVGICLRGIFDLLNVMLQELKQTLPIKAIYPKISLGDIYCYCFTLTLFHLLRVQKHVDGYLDETAAAVLQELNKVINPDHTPKPLLMQIWLEELKKHSHNGSHPIIFRVNAVTFPELYSADGRLSNTISGRSVVAYNGATVPQQDVFNNELPNGPARAAGNIKMLRSSGPDLLNAVRTSAVNPAPMQLNWTQQFRANATFAAGAPPNRQMLPAATNEHNFPELAILYDRMRWEQRSINQMCQDRVQVLPVGNLSILERCGYNVAMYSRCVSFFESMDKTMDIFNKMPNPENMSSGLFYNKCIVTEIVDLDNHTQTYEVGHVQGLKEMTPSDVMTMILFKSRVDLSAVQGTLKENNENASLICEALDEEMFQYEYESEMNIQQNAIVRNFIKLMIKSNINKR